jgi:hypothetical protein
VEEKAKWINHEEAEINVSGVKRSKEKIEEEVKVTEEQLKGWKEELKDRTTEIKLTNEQKKLKEDLETLEKLKTWEKLKEDPNNDKRIADLKEAIEMQTGRLALRKKWLEEAPAAPPKEEKKE